MITRTKEVFIFALWRSTAVDIGRCLYVLVYFFKVRKEILLCETRGQLMTRCKSFKRPHQFWPYPYQHVWQYPQCNFAIHRTQTQRRSCEWSLFHFLQIRFWYFSFCLFEQITVIIISLKVKIRKENRYTNIYSSSNLITNFKPGFRLVSGWINGSRWSEIGKMLKRYGPWW